MAKCALDISDIFKYALIVSLSFYLCECGFSFPRSNALSAIDGQRLGAGRIDCLPKQFQCTNGKCTQFRWMCDGEPDCTDSSDESPLVCNRNCTSNEFRCDNGFCIPKSMLCDKEEDCSDGSDEDEHECFNMNACDVGNFQCEPGVCIPEFWKCDGKPDCPNGLDEVGCLTTCSSVEFSCGNGECVDKKFVCDGEKDCSNARDEKDCKKKECESKDFMCPIEKKCISKAWLCDGDDDCDDGADEKDCDYAKQERYPNKQCTSSQWPCADKSSCIPTAFLCDGAPDCRDGSDESDALCRNLTCRSDQFQCKNRQCIDGKKQCDGEFDCFDKTDEEDCEERKKSCTDKEFDCGDGMCLPLSDVCNGHPDCPGHEDEPLDKCNINECIENNGGCNQICTDDPIGHHCSCQKGYTLIDNSTCVDINECLDDGTCSHTCINTVGSFKCECNEGYVKDLTDPTFCKAMHGRGNLLFSKRQDIRRLTLGHYEMTSVVNQSKNAGAMDYVFKTGTIFWTENFKTIYKAPIDAGFHKSIVIGEGIVHNDGLAIDWIYDHIYWTDTGKNAISVANFDGKMRKTLISTGMDEPRSIAVDPFSGWLFWSDWGAHPRIEKAGTDGSHRTTIISHNIFWPNGVTLDLVKNKIYWVDAKLSLLSSSNFDGSNRKTVLKSMEHLHLSQSLSIFEDTVYWTDWETQTIFKANKFNGSNVEPVIPVGSMVHDPMVVHVFHPYKQPPGINYCVAGNDRCSHFCFPAPRINERSPKISCACPDGMRLEEDSTICVEDIPPTPQIPYLRSPNTLNIDETVVNIALGPEESSGHITIIFTVVSSIIVAISGFLLFIVYRHYIHKNTVSMNFENFIYKKTTTTADVQPSKIRPRFGFTPPPAVVENQDETCVPLNPLTEQT